MKTKAEKAADEIALMTEAFGALGDYILHGSDELDEAVAAAFAHNRWFTRENTLHALHAIGRNFLNAEKIKSWLSGYNLMQPAARKKIGIVMAGNVPLAGFHDWLSVMAAGHVAMVKMSSKDRQLLPHLLKKFNEMEPRFSGRTIVAEQLKDFDAVIATGGNNTARYFEYYFARYPHIIRKNRNSVAVLTGHETQEQLQKLGSDIFLYFGLGCRSVSKLYVPIGYDFSIFFEAMEPFKPVIFHHGYKNNFDYQLTLLIMNKTPYKCSDFLILTENPSLASPIATLHYEYYDGLQMAGQMLQARIEEIQCVVSAVLEGSVPFGEAQSPQLGDYADGIDTIQFLNSLQHASSAAI